MRDRMHTNTQFLVDGVGLEHEHVLDGSVKGERKVTPDK